MEKLKIPYPIIVEGKYDRDLLSSVIDGRIITTDGFGIFKNHERAALLRALARKSEIIVLTDPDGAGGVIRSHIKSILPKDRTICLYVPRIEGKEKRKSAPSAEGVLGVEGMEREILYELFLPYTDGGRIQSAVENPLSAAILFEHGLTGRGDSAQRRDRVGERFGLPCGMSAKAFLAAMRLVCSYEEYLSAVEDINKSAE